MAFADYGPVLLFALVAGLVVLAMVRSVRRIQRKAAQPVVPVPLPPEEVELEEGPVHACMRCGSPSVHLASLREGGIPGAGGMLTWICGRCAHRGPAVEFDDVTSYRQFLKGLHGAAEGE